MILSTVDQTVDPIFVIGSMPAAGYPIRRNIACCFLSSGCEYDSQVETVGIK